MALSDHTLIAAYPLGSGIADLQDSYDGYSAQNMTFAGDGDLSGLPVADFNSSYYGVDNDLYNGFDTEYSFSMWMKPDTIAHSWLMNNEQHGSYYATWGVLLQADGQLHLFVRNANGGAYDIARTGVSLVVDEWSHVAATWNGTEIKWYVDGALVSTTAASRIPWNSPATLWIGANATKSGVQKYYFDGKMSDLRFWYSELTASDVAELHAAGQVPIDLGMDAKYALDTDATDSVGSANGTASGVTFSTSAGRSFADFGANSYIDLGVSSGFDISGAGDFSVSAWINPDSLSLPFGQIAGSVVSGASSPANAGWQLAINQGVLRFRVGGSGSHEDLDYTLPVDVAGSWNHVTATRDGTSVKLYLNGVEVASGTFASVYDTHTATAWHKMSIGGYYANSQWYTGYDGKIDDVRIWNRNLSAIEVESLHLATTVTPSLTDDLVIHHNCDDATAEIGEDVTFTDVSIGTSSGRTHWDFANLNSKAVLSDPNNLPDMSGDWTVSMWFSEMTAPTTWRSIARSQTENLGVVSSPSHSPANTLGVYTTTAFVSAGYSMNYLNFQNWNHMVIVGSGTTTKFYINGSHVGTAPVKISSDLYALNNTFSGNHSQLFANNMDDVRVWSRALSDSEVSTLHTETIVTPSLTDDLIHKWSLDTDGSAEVGSVDLVAHNSATHIDNVGSLPEVDSGFHPATSIALNPSAGYTISIWFKGLKSNAWNPFIAGGSSGTGGNHAGSTAYYDIAFDSTDLHVWMQTSPYYRRSGYDMMSDTNLDTGWHNIVAAYSGTQTIFYVDGVQVGNPVTWSGSPSIQTFGSWKNMTDRAPADFMDDIRVWSRTLSASEVTALHAAGAEAPSGAYDWTHGGNLSDIVKFSRGSDISGNPSYAYAKKEPGDDTTTLYFATDFQTWSTFSSYASGVSSIVGSPICMEYGPNGKVLVGTDSGKVYEITLDGSSVPQSYSLVHSMAGSEDIKVIKYGTSSNLWAFEAGGKVYTIPVGGGAAVEKLDLNVVDQAGSIVQDMSEANDAWSIVVRRPDFTFVVYLVSPDWSTVNNPASLQAVLSAINPVDLNYFYDIDTWCASGADGTVITTDDINNWIA